MAFTPFVDADLPTMANFNEKFQEAIQAAMDGAADAGVKIATGSYVGSGVYGASKPNSLTFDFEPKAVFLIGRTGPPLMFCVSPFTMGIHYGNGSYGSTVTTDSNQACVVSWDEKTMTWYSAYTNSGVYNQMNVSGETYYYIALG